MKFKVIRTRKVVEIVDADSEQSARDEYVNSVLYTQDEFGNDSEVPTGKFKNTLSVDTKVKTIVTAI